MASCFSPPAISDEALLLYVDDPSDLSLRDHLERCPACAGRAEAWRGVTRRLTGALYRQSCPDPQELGDLHLGLLAPERRTALEAHLALCPHCTRELALTRRVLGEAARAQAGPDLLEGARALVARLLSPRLDLAAAAVRGGDEAARFYAFEGGQLALEAQPEPGDPSRRMLVGTALGLGPGVWRAELWRGDELLQTAPVEALGQFVLEALLPGRYALILTGPEPDQQVRAGPIDL